MLSASSFAIQQVAHKLLAQNIRKSSIERILYLEKISDHTSDCRFIAAGLLEKVSDSAEGPMTILYAWHLLLEYFDESSYRVKQHLQRQLSEQRIIEDHLIPFALDTLDVVEGMRPYDLSLWAVNEMDFNGLFDRIGRDCRS